MRTPSAPTVRAAVASALAVVTMMSVSGCSSDDENTEEVSVEPQPPAQSPPAAVTPAGIVTDFAPVNALTFEPATRTLVALTDESTSVSLIREDAPAQTRAIDLGSTGADVIAGRDSTVLVPMDGGIARIDTADGQRTDLALDADALSAVDLPDGTTAVGDDTGTVRVLDASGQVTSTVSGGSVTSADALASTEKGVSVLDRRQTSVTDLDLDDGTLGVALRAGEGAAQMTSDEFGRLLVTDSTGTELLVFTSHDLLMRQRFPVGSKPWAIAYDERSGIVWVTLPALNEVVGYTLDTGIPVEAERLTTVRQPDSIAVDADTGDLYVGSATGDGLQRIPAASR
ncbi:YncE family protein [Rhodococcus sp. NPDC078407]|uniref:YncE family protein n=1 Tax=Rhodococcus sp. NPDC078407 TaxID=3364509 RepID=UPI0037C72F16